MPKWPLHTRVEVDWRDSMSEGGWHSVKHFRKGRKGVACRSLGYLLAKTRRVVQLSQSLNRGGGVADTITIPRSCVTRLRRVRGAR